MENRWLDTLSLLFVSLVDGGGMEIFMTMQTTKSENKNAILQIMRGLAITVVLVHHAIARTGAGGILQTIDDILICFHMPTFFIISGYLYQLNVKRYRQKGAGDFLLKKVKHLLVPYAFWYVLLWGGIQVACSLSNSVENILLGIGFGPMEFGEMIYGLLTYEVYYVEHLWFVYVLFLFFLVHTILGELGSNKLLMVVGILLGFLTYIMSLPNIIERFMVWFVFFVFGRCIGRYKIIITRIKKIYWIIPSLIFFALSATRIILKKVNLEMNDYIFFIVQQSIKYMIGFLGVWLLYFVAIYLNSRKNMATTVAQIIGDYSYDIYLMHNPYFLALSATLLYSFMGLNAYISVLIAVVIGLGVPMAISRLIIRRCKPLSVVMIGKG